MSKIKKQISEFCQKQTFTLKELFNKKTLVSYIEAAQTKKLIEEE